MALCTSGDVLYAYENNDYFLEKKLKLKAPKPSYEIITEIKKNENFIKNVEIKPIKEDYYNKSIIPNWIEVVFYSIPKKNKKRITVIHIINKCLVSNNPYILESNMILYCHENNQDLLHIFNFLLDISIQMKCDIISFDYQGFGYNYNNSYKPKLETIPFNAEETLNFSMNKLNYKIENIIIMGKDIGAIPAIYLSSKDIYSKCKSLILYNPVINLGIKDIKIMRMINCKCLLIMEVENKEEISQNEVIYLCREIPNEQEWFPLKKKKNVIINNKFNGFKKYMNENTFFDDIYFKHRSKFIIKLRDYVYPEEENIQKRIKGSSSIGESTDSDTNLNSSINKMMNFDNVKENKEEEKKDDKKDISESIFDQPEIQINNNDDY